MSDDEKIEKKSKRVVPEKMKEFAFQKGKSGNPLGRPKEFFNFRSMCRQFVNASVVQAWCQEVLEKGPNWLKASELLAAYGYGRPSQTLEVDTTVSVAKPLIDMGMLTPEQRILLQDTLSKQLHERLEGEMDPNGIVDGSFVAEVPED